MEDYTNLDDLSLYLSFIKSVEINYSERNLKIFLAQPSNINSIEKPLKYTESILTVKDLSKTDWQQNLIEKEVPEFYRSAIIQQHPNYSLEKGEVIYFFGVDWGSEYYHWHFVGKSHQIIPLSPPKNLVDLTWVV